MATIEERLTAAGQDVSQLTGGEVTEVEIDTLGTLRNPVVAE